MLQRSTERRDEIKWPAKPPDYFLYGYLKSKVYATEQQNLDELQKQILQEAVLLDRDLIRNAVSHFYNHIACFQEATASRNLEKILKNRILKKEHERQGNSH